jgi:peptide/nickel transport system permease protein
MTTYIVSRLAQSIFVILGVTFVTFALMFLSGDPTALLVRENLSKEEIATFRHEMGFDEPWPVQYVKYLGRAIEGDFGKSFRYRRSVTALLVERMPATLLLAGSALLLAILIPIPLGVIAATHAGKWPDGAAMLFAVGGQAMPSFWLGIIVILVFGLRLRALPISGMGAGWDILPHLVLPAVTLSTYSIARNARLIRSGLLEVLGQDYIRTARAKGLSETIVVYRHALRNSLLSIVSIMGLEVGFLLGGAIVTETIFAWPGMGRLTIEAIQNKDIFLVQGAVTFMAIIFVIVNLAVDLLYTVIDPRIRYR